MSAKAKGIMFGVLLGAATLAIELGAHGGGHADGAWWHTMPGFELLFGLAGAGLLTAFAKLILFPLVKRKEDYYR